MKNNAQMRAPLLGAESYSWKPKGDRSHQAVLAHVLRNSAPFNLEATVEPATRLIVGWPMFKVKILTQRCNAMVTRMTP